MERYIQYSPLIISVFLFASFSPFIICLFYFLYIFRKGDVNAGAWVALIVSSSIAISAINAVKVPDNDLEQYIYLYHLSKDLPLWQYIFVGSTAGGLESVKEPFYPVIVWVLNLLCCDNEVLFKFSFSFINYLLLNISVYYVGRKNKIDIHYILFGLFLMTFIPYIFTLSLQVLRQFLAGAFLMIILSLVCFSSVKMWKLCLMAFLMVLIHSTSLFFLPFLFLKAFDKKWSDAKIWYIGIVSFLVLIQVVSLILTKFVGGLDNSLSYALERASQNTEFESEGLGVIAIFLLLVVIYLSYKITIKSDLQDEAGVRRFFNVPLFLSFFVLINLHQKELSLRMLFYTYPFVPIIAMFYCKLKEVRYSTLIIGAIPVLLFFIIYLEFGTWTYDIPYSFIFSPLVCFLI
jgi:hypothetical protein